jgi:hypothetical protein
MPPGPISPDQLHDRAAALRRLALRIEQSPALDLHRRAGEDVWVGPTPAHCHEELLDLRRQLLAAADDLRDRAQMLDARAAQLAGLA